MKNWHKQGKKTHGVCVCACNIWFDYSSKKLIFCELMWFRDAYKIKVWYFRKRWIKYQCFIGTMLCHWKIVEVWKWRNCIFQNASLREYTLEVCYLAALQLIGNIPNIFLSVLPCSANWERPLGRVFTSKVGDLALGVEYIPFYPWSDSKQATQCPLFHGGKLNLF